jgi:hypothetical protein
MKKSRAGKNPRGLGSLLTGGNPQIAKAEGDS